MVTKTKNGRTFIEVFYSGDISDADQAIEKAVSEHGLDRGKVSVVALPLPKETREAESNG